LPSQAGTRLSVTDPWSLLGSAVPTEHLRVRLRPSDRAMSWSCSRLEMSLVTAAPGHKRKVLRLSRRTAVAGG